MGKRRKTVKTGEKALYGSKQDRFASKKQGRDGDDDPMYDGVDRFHNERDVDYLALDSADDDDGDNGEGLVVRHDAIMDLGIDDYDDDDDDGVDSDGSLSSSNEVGGNVGAVGRAGRPSKMGDSGSGSGSDSSEGSEEVSDEDDDGTDPSEFALDDPRRWGRKKSFYYHGDTADLEIGQDQEDAYLEEEAAKEIQAARLKEMSEDDFVLSDDEQERTFNKNSAVTDASSAATKDISTLSAKDKRIFLKRRHPELLPILNYFSDMVEDLRSRTTPGTDVLFDGEEGAAEAINASASGQRYLLTKAMLQSSAALNVAMYLLLKADAHSGEGLLESDLTSSTNMQAHPVLMRLEQLNGLLQKLEVGVEAKAVGVSKQLDKLAQAAALLSSGDMDEGDSDSQSSANGDDDDDNAVGHSTETNDREEDAMEYDDSDSEVGSESQDDTSSPPVVPRRPVTNVQNEARFALRSNEILSLSKSKQRARRPTHPSLHVDFGDGNTDDTGVGLKSFASTINSIEQRSKVYSKTSKKTQDIVEQLDEHEENDQNESNLDMMDDNNFGGGASHKGTDDDEFVGNNLDDEVEKGDFYSKVAKKSAAKKKQKKAKYQVQPKYPRMDKEVAGERAVSKMIMKNRGLVAHKSKLNRNPRAKKREQYRKAIVRRKGAVRDIRTGETHKYGGEGSGIRSGISRSRQLG